MDRMTPRIEALKYILSTILAEGKMYVCFVRQSLSTKNINQWVTFFKNAL